jgi:hypothetical protein
MGGGVQATVQRAIIILRGFQIFCPGPPGSSGRPWLDEDNEGTNDSDADDSDDDNSSVDSEFVDDELQSSEMDSE